MTDPKQSLVPNSATAADGAMQPDWFTETLRAVTAAAGKPTPWMSVDEVADTYGLSIRTVRRRWAAGRMPARTRRSHKLVYLREDIERLMATGGAPT